MQIKMIRDFGKYKKGETYDVDDKTATELLTKGYCVYAKSKPAPAKKK